MEFYQEPSGEIIVKRENADAFLLTEKCRDFIIAMKTLLISDYYNSYRGCQDMNLKSRANTIYYDFLNVRQFIKCNFNQFDNVKDIDESGCFHFEFVNCPLRGTCKYENVICNPTFTTHLTDSDRLITKMIVNSMKTEQIALSLSRSIHTINNRRRTILKKTGCKNVAQLTAFCYEHKII